MLERGQEEQMIRQALKLKNYKAFVHKKTLETTYTLSTSGEDLFGKKKPSQKKNRIGNVPSQENRPTISTNNITVRKPFVKKDAAIPSRLPTLCRSKSVADIANNKFGNKSANRNVLSEGGRKSVGFKSSESSRKSVGFKSSASLGNFIGRTPISFRSPLKTTANFQSAATVSKPKVPEKANCKIPVFQRSKSCISLRRAVISSTPLRNSTAALDVVDISPIENLGPPVFPPVLLTPNVKTPNRSRTRSASHVAAKVDSNIRPKKQLGPVRKYPSLLPDESVIPSAKKPTSSSTTKAAPLKAQSATSVAQHTTAPVKAQSASTAAQHTAAPLKAQSASTAAQRTAAPLKGHPASTAVQRATAPLKAQPASTATQHTTAENKRSAERKYNTSSVKTCKKSNKNLDTTVTISKKENPAKFGDVITISDNSDEEKSPVNLQETVIVNNTSKMGRRTAKPAGTSIAVTAESVTTTAEDEAAGKSKKKTGVRSRREPSDLAVIPGTSKVIPNSTFVSEGLLNSPDAAKASNRRVPLKMANRNNTSKTRNVTPKAVKRKGTPITPASEACQRNEDHSEVVPAKKGKTEDEKDENKQVVAKRATSKRVQNTIAPNEEGTVINTASKPRRTQKKENPAENIAELNVEETVTKTASKPRRGQKKEDPAENIAGINAEETVTKTASKPRRAQRKEDTAENIVELNAEETIPASKPRRGRKPAQVQTETENSEIPESQPARSRRRLVATVISEEAERREAEPEIHQESKPKHTQELSVRRTKAKNEPAVGPSEKTPKKRKKNHEDTFDNEHIAHSNENIAGPTPKKRRTDVSAIQEPHPNVPKTKSSRSRKVLSGNSHSKETSRSSNSKVPVKVENITCSSSSSVPNILITDADRKAVSNNQPAAAFDISSLHLPVTKKLSEIGFFWNHKVRPTTCKTDSSKNSCVILFSHDQSGVQCGILEIPPGGNRRIMFHCYDIVLTVLSGKGVIRFEADKLTVESGDLCVVPKGVPYAIQNTEEVPMRISSMKVPAPAMNPSQ